MKFLKKVVDERENIELLKLGNFCYWLTFILLVISIISQRLLNIPVQQTAGEIIILAIGAVTFLLGCIKKGVWDFYTKPTVKIYLLSGLIGAFLLMAIEIIRVYMTKGDIIARLPSIALHMAMVFVVIAVILAITGSSVKKRNKEAQKEYQD